MVAQNTDLRASLASGTVKKRIKMCGKPAVPNINAIPKEMAEIGSLMKPPGPMMDMPTLAASVALAFSNAADAAAAASGVAAAAAEAVAAAIAASFATPAKAVFTSTPLANRASGLKPNCAKTMKAMKVTPASSMIALIICTQVVAVIPPNNTYTIINAPTSTTAIQ